MIDDEPVKISHDHAVTEMLKPKGSLKEGSLGAIVVEHLRVTFKDWTNPAFSNSVSADDAMSSIKKNYDSEVSAAWNAFADKV